MTVAADATSRRGVDRRRWLACTATSSYHCGWMGSEKTGADMLLSEEYRSGREGLISAIVITSGYLSFC